MTTRVPFARTALSALVALSLAATAAPASAVTAELRVLTPDRVLDPGTNYAIADEVTVPTRPDADCLGPPGGSGAEYPYSEPVALGLLASAARADRALRPLSVTDQFGFGQVICGIGGVEAGEGEFWYLKRNHVEAGVGADQLEVENGDEILFYLAQDNFPEPNPAELELIAPARALSGQPFEVSVVQHACVTQSEPPFETRCETTPAAGVTVSGGTSAATTASDGTAQVTPGSSPRDTLIATRGADIPSKSARVCISAELSQCPASPGERFVGSPDGDRIRGTRGPDAVRARGGADRIRVRGGDADRVDCGPGSDRVVADDADRVARDCEKVRSA